jgi:hypothetical protein
MKIAGNPDPYQNVTDGYQNYIWLDPDAQYCLKHTGEGMLNTALNTLVKA